MKTIKGPALFLGQFAGDTAPFDTWDGITRWAADCGYIGVQVPTWAGQLIDLEEGGVLAGLLRRDQGRRQGERRRGDRALDAPAGAARGGAPGL